MSTRLSFVGALALALAACSAGETAEEDEAVSTNVETVEEATNSENSSETASQSEDSETDAEPATETAALDGVPAKFHGVWDATTGTCSAESDARLEISAKELSFYESFGSVTAVETQGDGVKVSVAMEGEGEEWNEAYVFTMDGDTLNQTIVGADGGSFKRKRCS